MIISLLIVIIVIGGLLYNELSHDIEQLETKFKKLDRIFSELQTGIRSVVPEQTKDIQMHKVSPATGVYKSEDKETEVEVFVPENHGFQKQSLVDFDADRLEINREPQEKIAPAYSKETDETPIGIEIVFDNLFAWMKIDWPMKIGGLIFLLGIGWFISYAIMNNWISPMMRIIMAMATGVVMIGGGIFAMEKGREQGGYLIAIGSAVYVISVYLGYKFFGFFGSLGSLCLVALQYVWMLLLAMRYNNHWMHDVGLFFSLVSPFFFSSGSGNIFGLFSYLALHIASSRILTRKQGWSMSYLTSYGYIGLYILLGFIAGWIALSSIPVMIIIVSLVLGFFLFDYILEKQIGNGLQVTIIAVGGSILYGYLMYILPLGYPDYFHNQFTQRSLLGGGIVYMIAGFLSLEMFQKSLLQQSSYLIAGLLFIAGFLFLHFTGIDLLLVSILFVGLISAIIIGLFRNRELFVWSTVLWVVPFFLFIWNYSSSNYYIMCWLVIGVVMLGLYGLLVMRDTDNDEMQMIYFIGSITSGVVAIILYVSGYTTIFSILGYIAAVILLGYTCSLKRDHMLLVSLFLFIPLWLLVQYNFEVNYTLFGASVLIVVSTLLHYYLYGKDLAEGVAKYVELTKFINMLIAGIAVLLSVIYLVDSQYYTLMYTGLSLITIFLVRKFGPVSMYTGSLGLMIIPIVTSLVHIDGGNYIVDSLSLLLLSSTILYIRLQYLQGDMIRGIIGYALSLGYLFLFIRIQAFEYASGSTAIAIILILFTIIGLGFYLYGKIKEDTEKQYIGTAVLIVVIARVLMIEIWSMSLIMKIVTCLGIGALLLMSGFVGKKKVEG